MIRRPPRSTLSSSSAASDVYKRQRVEAAEQTCSLAEVEWLVSSSHSPSTPTVGSCSRRTVAVREFGFHHTLKPMPQPALHGSVSAAAVAVGNLCLSKVHSDVAHLDEHLVNVAWVNNQTVAVLELNDPRHYNAEDLPLMFALRVQVSRLVCAPSVGRRLHALILRGAGAHFCTGGAAYADAVMRQVLPQDQLGVAAVVTELSDCITILSDVPVPVLAVLHGKLIGGGIALALHTDWRSCTSSATFNHGNLSRNMSPIAGFSQTFGRSLGQSLSQALYLEDQVVAGPQALAAGLVHLLAPTPDEALSTSLYLAQTEWCSKTQQRIGSDRVCLEAICNSKSILQNVYAMNSPAAVTVAATQQSRDTEVYQLVGDETLSFRAIAAQRLPSIAPDECEVRMSAYGLNFREVLHMLGMVAMPNGTVGIEGAGTVVKAGHAVTGFEIGDRVFGCIGADFASYSTAHSSMLLRLPESVSFAEASSMYIAWMTVDQAFGRLCADLSCSDTVLIHSASGGVGISAMRLAQANHALVIATAGQDRKRQWIREQGVLHVSSTRDHDRLDQDLAWWFGVHSQCLTVVMNALSDRFVSTGFQRLSTGGKFVEIGKREIWTAEEANAYRVDVSFMPIDETVTLPHLPVLIRTVEKAVQAHRFTSLPLTIFSESSCGAAFQFLRGASHIGKVVVSLASSVVPTKAVRELKGEALAQSSEFLSEFHSADPQTRGKLVESMVGRLVTEVTAGQAVAVDEALMDSVLDSLAVTELGRSLQRELGNATKLPSTLVFEHPNIRAVSTFLTGTLAALSATGSNDPAEAAPSEECTLDETAVSPGPLPEQGIQLPAAGSRCIGVTGISLQLPGGVDSLDSFWNALDKQMQFITHSPPASWSRRCAKAGLPAAASAGAFLNGNRAFDSEQWGLTSESARPDEHVKLLLQSMDHALQDAGSCRQALRGASTAVLTAVDTSNFTEPISSYMLGRVVAWAFQTDGSARNLDFACSSGYLAIELAADSVQRNECQIGIVGSAFVLQNPSHTQTLLSAGILSPTGTCLLYTSPSPRDRTRSRMPSSA
eukprot:TRINITY_DN51357_c0_g1_i1.p1 TRINITY_DN51357_c0_g1~~TRINITY_DN51357_c0_g1_i1.p1  ORF type:complete len:1060 (+),score=154.17 TRINITY_DN51357_c0_g1_i1:117-3296(+)